MYIEGKVILLWRRLSLLLFCSICLLVYVILQFFLPPLLTPQPFIVMLMFFIVFGAELWVSERLSKAVFTKEEIIVTIAYGFGAVKTRAHYIPTDDLILQMQFFMVEGVKTVGFPYLNMDNHCKIIFHLGGRKNL